MFLYIYFSFKGLSDFMSLGWRSSSDAQQIKVSGHEGIRGISFFLCEYYCSQSLESAREKIFSRREAVDNGLKSYSE